MPKYNMQKYKVQDKVIRRSGNSFSNGHLKLPLYAYAKHTFIVAALSCLVHGGSAWAQTDEASTPKVTGVLSESVRLALFNHPEVSEANARVCQAIHRLGLGRALRRPQVNLTVSGGQQLFDRIREDKGRQVPTTVKFGNQTIRSSKTVYDRSEKDRLAGAKHRQYKRHEKEGVYDATVSLRYNLIDWGSSKSDIEAKRLQHKVSQIDAKGTLSERSFQLLTISIRLAMYDDLLAEHKLAQAQVAKQIALVQARVESGVGRLSDLRAAKLIGLDLEIAASRLQSQREQVIESLDIDLGLSPSDAKHLFTTYRERRPLSLATIEATQTEKAHALRLQIEAVDFEQRQIRTSKYMRIDGVLDATVFDVRDYEDEYELVGKLEFKMPLYDGGAARARLREATWRQSEIKASLDKLHRGHSNETNRNLLRFEELEKEIGEQTERLAELEARLSSLQARQGRTVTSPLEVAGVMVEINQVKTTLIQARMEQEGVRSSALFIAEKLDDVLLINLGENGC
ncbi:TolC family protein [uncultured Candidatus Puniceispirillum sp.]|uniref:TolC family protein n=1 Tax=uncultured Candidatus Puniceispirillum sp. TaxID=1985115 RepID=UPI0032B11F19